jgi:cytochrome b pre-mRNA-processing protein 3
MLAKLFSRRRNDGTAWRLHATVVTHSRRPEFYFELGVPDTVVGRFEVICLHAVLLLRRLRVEGSGGDELGQQFFDVMFADIDGSLRELGVGDLGVGPRVKRLARHFYGRMEAYGAGLDAGASATLEAALGRNLYAGEPVPPDRLKRIAGYMCQIEAGLAAQPFARLAEGEVVFVPPPGAARSL